MAKITKSTVKSFIRKNFDNLYINVKSRFDGMTDMCEQQHDGFTKATNGGEFPDHTLGVDGAWFVGSSRDYFYTYEDDTYTGIKVINACGSFILAVKK